MSSDGQSELHEEFVRLFSSHDRRLYGYILALVRDNVVAEEVFSETSLVLWREFPKFRRSEDFAPWALAIAFNQVRKSRRQRKSERLVFSESLVADLAAEGKGLALNMESRKAALKHCVGQLSERTQQMIDWFYDEKLRAGEIAERWGLTVHAVYKSLKTTRRFLYDCIEQQLQGDR